jgi:hypothetical protein
MDEACGIMTRLRRRPHRRPCLRREKLNLVIGYRLSVVGAIMSKYSQIPIRGATVRISPASHQSLMRMAKETNSSLQEMLDQAIETQRRRLLLKRTNGCDVT